MRPVAVPLYDATAPIACTASPAQLDGQLARLARLRDALLGVERTEHGLLLRFPATAGLEDELVRFAVDEKACCTFWGFAVERDDDGGGELRLRWDAPPDAVPLVDQLERYLRVT